MAGEILASGVSCATVGQASVAAEKFATSHSEGLGSPEESAFSWVWRRKSRSLGRRGDLGMTKKHFFRSLFCVNQKLLWNSRKARIEARIHD
jgi:hypothetical protein